MRKIFLLNPRQSGKTDKAIYEFLKDPDNTIFICHNPNLKDFLCKRINASPKLRKNFISAAQPNSFSFAYEMKGKQPKNIILDEYMFFQNKREIYEHIMMIRPENVYIFSTSDKMYDEKIFEFVKKNKPNYSLDSLIDFYKKEKYQFYHKWEEAEKEIVELYYNFLTDYDTILIDHNFTNSNFEDRSNKFGMPEREYAVQIMNKYTTKDTDFLGDSDVNPTYFPYNI